MLYFYNTSPVCRAARVIFTALLATAVPVVYYLQHFWQLLCRLVVNAQIARLFIILLAAVVPAASILTICRVAAVPVGV